jgi:tRNA dimethylallyltransferase
VGKSEVALVLAERLEGEIISVDSMQVYRGLDIGTAKPSLSERARVRHHLIDFVEINESFDAAQFAKLARQSVADIQQRGRVPIFCGGTGLYLKAFLEGLGDSPPSNPGLRAELERTPYEDLLRELAQRDPDTFNQIDRQNPRRVFRALEVIRLTGVPFSRQRARWLPSPNPVKPYPMIGLTRSSEDLRARINLRVEQMFQDGLVTEVEQLLRRGLAENRVVMQALGYRQVVGYLQGSLSLTQTIELVKTRTRQFAKRQLTWFRRQFAIEWLQLAPTQTPHQTADQVLRTVSSQRKSPAAE